jgi:hypothetical protein
MRSAISFTVVSALLGYVLLATAHAQPTSDIAWSPSADLQAVPEGALWPMGVATTPEARICIKALMEEEAAEGTVSAAVGQSFIGCMQLAHAENFYEFDRHKANGTILMNKTSPCLKKALGSGAICVVVPVETTDNAKGKIVIASPNATQALSLTIGTSTHKREPGEPLGECKNSYGDPCGTKY